MKQDLHLRLMVLSWGECQVSVTQKKSSIIPNHTEVWRKDTGQPGNTFLRRPSEVRQSGSPAYHRDPAWWRKPAHIPLDSLLDCQPLNPFLATWLTFPELQSYHL